MIVSYKISKIVKNDIISHVFFRLQLEQLLVLYFGNIWESIN